AVVIAGANRVGSGELARWSGLGRLDARLGILVAIFFFSLAGIPPLAGWFAKFAMFRSVILAGGTATVVLAVIATVNAVIAFYYYSKVVKAVWFDAPALDGAEDSGETPTGSLRLALLIAAGLTILIGFFPAIATFVADASRVIAGIG
ncbi:MAG: proton-conducting transporter membrane subunit, partial [Acidimicrobiia bacterium]|nr:proton-conducting transporter membrane subunit [Acidimicrobiia bacterium]